jgi:hypothetical protein
MDEAAWLACADPEPMLEFLRGKVSDRKRRLFACACCRRIWHLLSDERNRRAVELAEAYADGRIPSDQLALVRDAVQEGFRDASKAEHWAEPEANFCDSIIYSRVCTALYGAAAVRATVAARADQGIELSNAHEKNEAEWERTNPGRGCYVWTAAALGRAEHPHVYEAIGMKNHDIPAGDALQAAQEAAQEAKRIEAKEQAKLLREIVGNPYHLAPLDPSPPFSTVAKLACTVYEERVFERLPVLADALEDAGCTDAAILSHCRQPGEHVRGCWVVDLLLGKE